MRRRQDKIRMPMIKKTGMLCMKSASTVPQNPYCPSKTSSENMARKIIKRMVRTNGRRLKNASVFLLGILDLFTGLPLSPPLSKRGRPRWIPDQVGNDKRPHPRPLLSKERGNLTPPCPPLGKRGRPCWIPDQVGNDKRRRDCLPATPASGLAWRAGFATLAMTPLSGAGRATHP